MNEKSNSVPQVYMMSLIIQCREQIEWVAHSTTHDRFQTWVEAGVFLDLWRVGIEQFDEFRGSTGTG